MNSLRFAIAGCGMISRTHARVICHNPRTSLVGAYSKTLSSAQKFCSEFEGVKPFSSYEDMVKDPDIDVIVICTPSGEHFNQAYLALQNGKHVYVEKPITIKTEDADVLIELAEKKGLTLCAVSQTRFSDAVQAVKRAVDDGAFGKMISAQLMMRFLRTQDYYNSAAWRGTWEYDGGGILMNQGIHGIDVLCYIMGRPVSVCGYSKTLLRDIEVEDTAVSSLEFENGALGVIDATVCSKPSMTKTFIFAGEKGTVILENDVIKLWGLDVPCPVKTEVSVGGSSSSDPKGISDAYHARELENLVCHILDRKPLLVDGKEGRLPLSVILSVYESSKTGKKVEIK